ncbi:MAG: branched-chain amino acid ABC transporter permease [Deltaproteobacteria bacterium]|nr:branched-chain amino acid ABC transporter permease [Deltaproteobacteria bacterium]MBW2049679.1 branched-chain amino acid ABC transporter permease [Deltaproteobacteria bacterium]MBW2112062.1 branched-chain amino acid ABC transporter permease [Deltaproteobacteria bacterium]MBW2354395.1 branched-chain amino acid ABC transporter permease [Deltaproteobacteria bacterium]
MVDLIQALGSGVLVGLVYALLGLSVVIIYRASEAFNFAVGEFLVIGSFLFYVLFFDINLPLLVALPLGLLGAAMVGALVERLTIKPLLGRSPLSMTIITLGLGFFLRACVQLIFGSHSYSFFLELPDITQEFGDLLFLSDPIWAGLLSLCTFGLIIFLLFRTRWGLAIRATSENQAKAMAFGINARFILLIVWAISSACIAAAGIMISNFGALSSMSAIVGLRAIPVVLIGGMDSIGGALVGGIIVGVCESLAGAYIEPMGLVGFKEVAPYLLLLIVLLIRPYGLFGEVRIERV